MFTAMSIVSLRSGLKRADHARTRLPGNDGKCGNRPTWRLSCIAGGIRTLAGTAGCKAEWQDVNDLAARSKNAANGEL